MATQEAAGNAGIPQLDVSTFANQIFWLGVSFVILYLVVSRIIVPRLDGIIDKRRRHRSTALASASEMNDQAQEIIAQSDIAFAKRKAEADEVIAAARASAREIGEREVARVNALIASDAAEAERRMAERRSAAPQEIAEIAQAAAAQILLRMLPASADAARVDAAVRARMESIPHLGTSSADRSSRERGGVG